MTLASFLALALSQAAAAPADGPVIPCSQVAIGYYTAGAELAMAETQLETADAATDAVDRQRRLDTAVEHYLMVNNVDGDEAVKACALDGLVEAYGPKRLNLHDKLEDVLKKRIAIKPDDVWPFLRLAALQEARGAVDRAEETLAAAEKQHPGDADIRKHLAALRARSTR